MAPPHYPFAQSSRPGCFEKPSSIRIKWAQRGPKRGGPPTRERGNENQPFPPPLRLSRIPRYWVRGASTEAFERVQANWRRTLVDSRHPDRGWRRGKPRPLAEDPGQPPCLLKRGQTGRGPRSSRFRNGWSSERSLDNRHSRSESQRRRLCGGIRRWTEPKRAAVDAGKRGPSMAGGALPDLSAADRRRGAWRSRRAGRIRDDLLVTFGSES